MICNLVPKIPLSPVEKIVRFLLELLDVALECAAIFGIICLVVWLISRMKT